MECCSEQVYPGAMREARGCNGGKVRAREREKRELAAGLDASLDDPRLLEVAKYIEVVSFVVCFV